MRPAGAPINPTNVAAGIDKAINAGVTLPAGFNNLFLLTPAQLVDALGALLGENNTQAQQGAFQLGTSYLSLLTDPLDGSATRGNEQVRSCFGLASGENNEPAYR